MDTRYRWFHKCLAKANHYCDRCHRLILPWTLCYAEGNYTRHLCNECYAELIGTEQVVIIE